MKPMAVTFNSIDQLNNYYIREFKNGGFFLPTENQSQNFNPNEKISLTIDFLGNNKSILTGRVAYISSDKSNEGIGISLDSNKENRIFKDKIEEIIKDKAYFNYHIFNNKKEA